MTTAALLVHGFGSNIHAWDGLDEQLGSHGIITERLALSGHGAALSDLAQTPWQAWLHDMRDGVRRLREQADVVALVGHSMGCTIGLYALDEHLVDRAVLIAPSVRVRRRSTAALSGLVRLGIKDVPTRLVGTRRGGEPDHPGYPTLKRMPVEALRTNLEFKASAADLVLQDAAPTLLIAGARDRVVGPSAAREVLGRFPDGTQLVLLAGGDHNLPMSNLAPKVWDLTIEFLLDT